jgi:hypothetical protein
MDAADLIARTVLYEGYILYPYRPTALKNRHRWSPGGLAPGGGAGSALRAECLVLGDESAVLSVRVRFLHPQAREGGGLPPAQEAAEREVEVPALTLVEFVTPRQLVFEFPAGVERDGEVRRTRQAVAGVVSVSAERLPGQVFRVAVRVVNNTPRPPAAGRAAEDLRTLASAHVLLRVHRGEFVSLTDPPDDLRPAAAGCRNEGVWPVLVGDPDARDTVLAPPVILGDFPRVAPESPGDFFDGTEIDEMLALRVLTLTDDEKREVAAADPRARAVLERVEGLCDTRLAGLHGAVRSARPTDARPGDRVRLRPRGRADAFDVLLAGKAATVVSIEEDFEGATHLAVTVDDDPGRDLGGRGMPGHRFFFRPDEVERLPEGGRG